MTHSVRMTAEMSLTYAPDYLAGELGYFADEGIDLKTDFGSGPGGSWLADNLAAKKAEIARGGIWIPLMYRDHLEHLTPFGMLCGRNTQLLMSRSPVEGFSWPDLYESTVLISSGATSQWMFLRGILAEQNVDTTRIKFVRDLHSDTTARLWRGGFADYYLVSAPVADIFLREGFSIAGRISDLGGPVPWSIYYAPSDFLCSNRALIEGFLRAIARGKKWVQEHSGEEVAELLKLHFPDFDIAVLADAVDRMRGENVWSDGVQIPEEALMRYQNIFVEYGLLPRPIPYSKAVDTESAKSVDSNFAAFGEKASV